MGAEEILALAGILGSLGGINGDPADSLGVELSPTVVTRDFALAASGRKWETNRKAGRNADGAREANEDGMEIGTVAATRFAGVVDIAAAPALARLVIFHGSYDVVVNGSRHLEIGLGVGRLHHFASHFAYVVVKRHEPIGAQIGRQFGGT